MCRFKHGQDNPGNLSYAGVNRHDRALATKQIIQTFAVFKKINRIFIAGMPEL